MIPAKRSSPFARARSFQTSQAPSGHNCDETETPPFSKRPGFARTMSNPFQVLSPSLKNVKNPFEKLALSPAGEAPTQDSDMAVQGNVEEDQEDEALDPNRTLKMFSISQPTTQASKNTPDTREDSDDDGLDEELEHSPEDLDTPTLNTKKPRLHEALEISVNPKKLDVAQELQAPDTSNNPSKKLGTEYKVSSRVPLDWTLKNSYSISSPDTLSWCDQGSTVDEIEALQVFVSNPQSQRINVSYSKPDQSLRASARTRLLSTMYHWIYPANSPTIPQAQSISRLLKNAVNMSSSEKNSITDLFSRSAEWKQTFRAIYQACRNGACPYFYYIGSTWTILFQHGSVSISGEIEAILTNSTPGLRKVLSEEDIAFERLSHISRKTTIHNFSAKHDLTDIDDNDSELAHEDNAAKAPLLQAGDQDLSDTLLFKAHGDVHGLFSYLLNLKTSYEDGFLYQSPSLIADVPFLHASLKRAQISKCRVVSKPVEGTDRMHREFRVDIQGILLPTSVRELCNIFASQQQHSGYSCIATSDTRSMGLNLRPLLLNQNGSLETSTFTSPKALDQLRYDHNLQQFTWLS